MDRTPSTLDLLANASCEFCGYFLKTLPPAECKLDHHRISFEHILQRDLENQESTSKKTESGPEYGHTSSPAPKTILTDLFLEILYCSSAIAKRHLRSIVLKNPNI